MIRRFCQINTWPTIVHIISYNIILLLFKHHQCWSNILVNPVGTLRSIPLWMITDRTTLTVTRLDWKNLGLLWILKNKKLSFHVTGHWPTWCQIFIKPTHACDHIPADVYILSFWNQLYAQRVVKKRVNSVRKTRIILVTYVLTI